MHCRNCGRSTRFVLVVECSVVADPPPEPSFAEPAWSLSVSCGACASTDVEGSAVGLLAAYCR